MTIAATVIADSQHPDGGARLTTLELRYPRFIHAEFMTHRVFSRNASSSRAIPVKRMIEDLLRDTAMPTFWGKNQPGMQAREECNSHLDNGMTREEQWLASRDAAIIAARAYERAGYHKQIVNRLLEPFGHINVAVTATDWDNFFLLRDHEDAQPEIRDLARAMKTVMDKSVTTVRAHHFPYVDSQDRYDLHGDPGLMAMVSAARCARVSYKTHDGRRPSVEEDIELFNQLCGSDPKHLSPLEHPCTASPHRGRIANLRDWRQLRKDYE